MPENNKVNIPKINNFKILGSSNKCACKEPLMSNQERMLIHIEVDCL